MSAEHCRDCRIDSTQCSKHDCVSIGVESEQGGLTHVEEFCYAFRIGQAVEKMIVPRVEMLSQDVLINQSHGVGFKRRIENLPGNAVGEIRPGRQCSAHHPQVS